MGAKEKIVVISFVSVTTLAIGYTQVYLPFYSDMAADRRKRVRDGTLGDKGRPGGPGSMWSNIDDVAKGKR
ncbi:unnamed protein product [Hapterophycus canaliculatus]